MKILVANLGSTSFKYRLFAMQPQQRQLARGGVDRIGSAASRITVEASGKRSETMAVVADHGQALSVCLRQLADAALAVLKDEFELAGVGFKAVHAEGYSGVRRIDEPLLQAMEAYADVCPAHNPPYVKAMRQMMEQWPHLPLVAAFETGFHATIPPSRRAYAIPEQWAQWGIQRWGFHGASHRYIAERTATLLGRADLKVISCHLGGSSSLCAIEHGQSRATSIGMSPQSGLPQNNRVGDFDTFALPVVLRKSGKTLTELLADLANHSGLQALSGSNGLEVILQRAEDGDPQCTHARAVYVEAIRHYLGAYLFLLEGADVVVFTGGIGENAPWIRQAVCEGAAWCGLRLDANKNQLAKGEMAIHQEGGRVQCWTVPTNEEWIVARQTWECLQAAA